MTEELDSLIEATDNEALTGEDLLVLQMKIAAHRYRMAEQVATLSRRANEAEAERKRIFALAKGHAKALSIGTRAIGEQAAADIAEGTKAVIDARSAEILAQAEYEAIKNKMHAAGDVLSSLQMRIAHLRDERRESRTHQAT